MGMKIHRWKISLWACAAVALLAGSAGLALAVPVPIELIHEGREDLFDTGGTRVTGCFGSGCPQETFSFGNTSGDVLWEVVEKVFYDPNTNTTKFTWTLFNDGFEDPITSFHAFTADFPVVDVGCPDPTVAGRCDTAAAQRSGSWHLHPWGQLGPKWVWAIHGDLAEEGGIAITDSLGGFSLTLSGRVPVTFWEACVDVGEQNTLRCSETDQWFTSGPEEISQRGPVIPEPTSLLLLGSGLVGVGLWGRKRFVGRKA